MPVLATKTEEKCKFCQSPDRVEIDAILERRHLKQLTIPQALAEIAKLDVENPNYDNMRLHFSKHCEFLTPSQYEAAQRKEMEQEQTSGLAEEILAMCDKEFGDGWQSRPLTNDEFLLFTRICSQHDMLLRIRRGEKTGATIDHGLKSVGEGTRRKHNESEEEMRINIGNALEGWANDAA